MLRKVQAGNGKRGSSKMRVIETIGKLLLVIGIGGFLAGLGVSLSDHPRLDAIELPLGDAEGLAVDAEGRMYVASRAYKRLQRYDAAGRFDRGWHLGGGRGEIALAVDPRGGIVVSIAGKPSESIDANHERRPIEATGSSEASPISAGPGPIHRLEAGWLTPVRVVRSEGGEERTVFRQGGLLWLLRSPLPVWLIAAAGIVVSFFSRRPR